MNTHDTHGHTLLLIEQYKKKHAKRAKTTNK